MKKIVFCLLFVTGSAMAYEPIQWKQVPSATAAYMDSSDVFSGNVNNNVARYPTRSTSSGSYTYDTETNTSYRQTGNTITSSRGDIYSIHDGGTYRTIRNTSTGRSCNDWGSIGMICN